MLQELNPGEHQLLLVSIQKFDHLIIPFETDYLNSFELISEDFQKYLIISDYELNQHVIPYQKPQINSQKQLLLLETDYNQKQNKFHEL